MSEATAIGGARDSFAMPIRRPVGSAKCSIPNMGKTGARRGCRAVPGGSGPDCSVPRTTSWRISSLARACQHSPPPPGNTASTGSARSVGTADARYGIVGSRWEGKPHR